MPPTLHMHHHTRPTPGPLQTHPRSPPRHTAEQIFEYARRAGGFRLGQGLLSATVSHSALQLATAMLSGNGGLRRAGTVSAGCRPSGGAVGDP
jgi:hypothetical protein